MRRAILAGTFKIGGDLEVNRLGYGAMRITGEGDLGPAERPRRRDRRPRAVARARCRLHRHGGRLRARGLRESHPRGAVSVPRHPCRDERRASTRHGPGQWVPVGRPEYLRQCCLMSLRRLGVERIDLWQLHRIDAEVPRDEQFGVMKELQEKARFATSACPKSPSRTSRRPRVFEVATVQNLYNLANRQSEDVLKYCEQNGIGFIPWFPAGRRRAGRAGRDGRQDRGRA